jgi:SAM-dependent methyltransferase
MKPLLREGRSFSYCTDMHGGAERSADGREAVQRLFSRDGTIYTTAPESGFMGWLARRDCAALLGLLQPRSGERALDVGCGAGIHARLLKDLGLKVSAIDLTARMVEAVRPHVDCAEVANLEELDLGERFDCVLCIGVLDFVADPAHCLANLARHLAPGGRLVIEVPHRSLGGVIYRWFYEQQSGIRLNLFSPHQLDEEMKRLALRSRGRRRPFFHSLYMGWARP